jgi:curved DNA-binding protein CbpA
MIFMVNLIISFHFHKIQLFMFSTATDNLELKGSLQTNPLVELLREFTEAKLSGSFRLSHEGCKIIVYLRNGSIVFAVSNLRQHKLFEILLQSNKITKAMLAEISDFTNDFALSEALTAKEIISKEEIDSAFSYQINLILQTAFNWDSGDWIFSSLARIKENISFKVDCNSLLANYARNLSEEKITGRFKSFEEIFGANRLFFAKINLLPNESFIFSRFDDSLMKVRDIRDLAGLSNAETMKCLYILWLGNFLIRKNWNSTLSENKIRQILNTKLSLKEVVQIPVKKVVEPEIAQPIQDEVLELPSEEIVEIDEKQLEIEYLDRIEKAESYYEMLEIPIKSSLAEIKTAYFKLAKNYHPDKYHQETNSKIQQRIQEAFTEIARAYETLKDETKRETYDFRLRKHLDTIKVTESTKSESPKNENLPPSAESVDKASAEFEQGFNHLMNEDYDQALPFLYRAVQISGDNAKYHAYYAKALSTDDKQRHKAESEMQSAIKLDPENATFRIMLVELFIQFKLLRRAEGELQRFLSQYPNNREAQILLENLPKKS